MIDVLVVEDERSVREGLAAALAQAEITYRLCEGIETAKRALAEEMPTCVLLDIRLKDGDGIAFLKELRASSPSLPVIMATAYGDSGRTIAAMKSGAFDYVTKPFDLDALLATIRRALRSQGTATKSVPPPPDDANRLLGQSATMLDVWKAIGRAASSDAPVLITGETGVGKELVAKAIHENSPRSAAPFVPVNIAALPAALVESELFGHEKGAFTGALARRLGRFETASRGTLFLDEIGDLDVSLQTKLLRVLQDGVFERIGSQDPCHSDARVVAATSQPVETMRTDLFYRLGVITIHVPPLRDRRSDIPILVHAFLALSKGGRRAISEAAMDRLVAYRWPGNVRELLHVVERACVMSTAEVLDVTELDLPRTGSERIGTDDDLDIRRATEKLERDLIERALAKAGGNRAEAARLLGIARPQLYAKMKELGVDPGERPKSPPKP